MARPAETTLREAWRLALQLALIRRGESDPSVKGWIGSEPPTYRLAGRFHEIHHVPGLVIPGRRQAASP